MELGEKLKNARLAAGLSQRQLCGGTITRNMLSQIENGAARPSMDTLRFLAAQLHKPVSYFLEEETVVSQNTERMALARRCWFGGDPEGTLRALDGYGTPDALFDDEKQLLARLALLRLARRALDDGRQPYAAELLSRLAPIGDGYCAEALERERLCLLAAARPELRAEAVRALPPLDGELLLRAACALEKGDFSSCAALLDAAGDHDSPRWNFLRAECYAAGAQYREAADCYHRAEDAFPEKTAPCLERCYRELEDYQNAYFYACKQR